MESLFPVLFVIGFPVLFCVVSWFIALVGGWRSIAGVYPDRAPTNATSFWMESGGFGLANYRGALFIDIGTDGVRFAVFPLFRLGHAPFFVPWEDLTVSEANGWLSKGARLTAARAPNVRILVRGACASALASQAEAHGGHRGERR